MPPTDKTMEETLARFRINELRITKMESGLGAVSRKVDELHKLVHSFRFWLCMALLAGPTVLHYAEVVVAEVHTAVGR